MPSPNGEDKANRNGNGRFKPGNPGGPGNPFAGKTARFRATVHECVTEEDFREVIQVLVEQAKAGERWAVIEFLNRTLGKPKEAIEVQGGDPAEDLRAAMIEMSRDPVIHRRLREMDELSLQ